MNAYYNENDPFAAEWLRQLIAAGLITPGFVDERDVRLVQPGDLAGFERCHFFAGIGGWDYALSLAGWSGPAWTGSCPCQPFSGAGRGKGFSDERHLWPHWLRLIRECAPPVVFGEQVASPDGKVWLARVHRDLETAAYSFGAADLSAGGISAPHVRQRVWFVAHSERERIRGERRGTTVGTQRGMQAADQERQRLRPDAGATGLFADRGMADSDRYHPHWWSGPLQVGRNAIEGTVERRGRKHRAQWRVKPGLSLLADGIPGRVDLCRGFGNAIVPQVAAEFIQAYREAVSA